MTRIVVFLPEYATSAAHVPKLEIANIPGDRITDLVYCFAGLNPQGSTFTPTWPNPRDPEPGPRHNTGQLALLKERYPALNIVISIGGWYNSALTGTAGYSGQRAAPAFEAVAAMSATRQAFVQQCIETFITPQHPTVGTLFTGIDIDWEYPKTPADIENIVLLLQEFRSQLDAAQSTLSRPMTLSACFGPNPGQMAALSQYGALATTLTWFNLMTYGGREPNSTAQPGQTTGFGAPLHHDDSGGHANFTIDGVVGAFIGAGMPADKLVFGVNTIGRSFGDVGKANNGVYQPYTGPGPTTPSAAGQGGGALAYFDLVDTYLSTPAYKHFFYGPTQSDYAYSAADAVWVTYDGPEGVRARADYVSSKGLGGMLLWELSTDLPSVRNVTPSEALALLDAMPRGIAGFANQTALLETGTAGPALAIYSGQIFLATNTPKLHISRSENLGATFGGSYEAPDESDAGPSLAATETELKIGWSVKGARNVTVATVDLTPDANGKLQIAGLSGIVTLEEEFSDSTPALASFAPGPFPSFPQTLVLAWTRRADKRLCFLLSKDGGATFGPIFASNETSSAGPALAVWGGAVNVAWLGSGGQINVAPLLFANGASAVEGLGRAFASPGTSDAAPALASDGSRLIAAWKGAQGAINVSVLLGNGQAWTGKYVSAFLTDHAPALASDGAQFPIAWRLSGTTKMNLAQVASY